MFATVPVLLPLVLAFVNVASAQSSESASGSSSEAEAAPTTGTISVFPVVPAEGLQGQVIGTGPDGTTFRLFGSYATFGIPFTETLVQDASHAEVNAIIETAGTSFALQGECAFLTDAASCEVGIGSATTTVTLPTEVLTPVPIISGTDELTLTGASSTSRSESVLPPSIATSTSTSSTGSGTTGTGPTSSETGGSDSDSGAVVRGLGGGMAVAGFVLVWSVVLPLVGLVLV